MGWVSRETEIRSKRMKAIAIIYSRQIKGARKYLEVDVSELFISWLNGHSAHVRLTVGRTVVIGTPVVLTIVPAESTEVIDRSWTDKDQRSTYYMGPVAARMIAFPAW